MKLIEALIKEGANKVAKEAFKDMFGNLVEKMSSPGYRYGSESELQRSMEKVAVAILEEDEELRRKIKKAIHSCVDKVLADATTTVATVK